MLKINFSNITITLLNLNNILNMQKLNLPTFNFKFKEKESSVLIFDEIRKKYVKLTPEEWVRQNFLMFLNTAKHCPLNLMALEMPFTQNETDKRSDIVVYNKTGQIIILVECKAPSVQLSQKVFDQAAGYNLHLKSEILIITNGISHYCCKPDYENRKWMFMNDIPDYAELTPSICID